MRLRSVGLGFLFSFITFMSVIQAVAETNNTALDCKTEVETLSALFMDFRADGKQWSKTTPIQQMNLSLYPERNSLPGVNNRADIDIPYVLTNNPSAPLVFIQSGLGGTGQSSYNFYLMGILHNSGFNVVSVPSQYFWRMSLATSPTMRPGFKQTDLRHLVQVYQSIRSNLEQKNLISKSSRNEFVGISNGGYNGVQIAGQQLPEITFDKFVVINPPLDLSYGLKTLDQIFLEGKKRVSATQYNSILGIFISLFSNPAPTLAQNLNFIEKRATATDLRYTIARQLIESVQESAAISQVIEDQNLFKSAKINDRLKETRSWSAEDYQNRILLPFFVQRNVSANEITGNTYLLNDLKTIAKQKNLLMIHAANDFISRPSDIQLARKILGSNALVTPCGGHVGELPVPEITNALVQFLKLK